MVSAFKNPCLLPTTWSALSIGLDFVSPGLQFPRPHVKTSINLAACGFAIPWWAASILENGAIDSSSSEACSESCGYGFPT